MSFKFKQKISSTSPFLSICGYQAIFDPFNNQIFHDQDDGHDFWDFNDGHKRQKCKRFFLGDEGKKYYIESRMKLPDRNDDKE